MHAPRSTHAQAGFSLVELMVALVIGLILTAGVISVFITSKSTYNLNNALGAVQENGRFAMGFIEPPLRMAGYTGCAHNASTYTNHLNGGTSASLDLAKSVEGYEAVGTGIGDTYALTTANLAAANDVAKWSPNLPSDISTAIGGTGTGAAIAGNDILVIHEASNSGFDLVSPYQDSAGVFVSSAAASEVADGQIAVMTDCNKSSLFQITNVSTSSGRVDHSSGSQIPGNCLNSDPDCSGPNWDETYGAGAKLLFYNSYVFYIGVGIDGSPSLYQVSIGSGTVNGALGAPQELVPGVENMQILYGVDTNADKIPNNFQTADTITDWSQVVCVRIALLTRSDDNSIDKAPDTVPSYVLLDPTAADGVTITAIQDRRLRRTFQETISIRNMLP